MLLTLFPLLFWSFACVATGEGFLRKDDNEQLLINAMKDEDVQNFDSHVFKESILRLSSRDDLVMHDRVSQEYIHHVIFVIKQRNMEELTRILYDVSNPTSTNYGQHMSREQVVEMTSNPEARDAVLTYLDSKGASVISETLGGEYITASAPISVWESILNTEFYTFHQTLYNGRVDKLVRAAKYSIPKGLDKHVDGVFNTIQMPLHAFGALPVPWPKKKSSDRIHSTGYDFTTSITPAKLKSFYHVGSNQGSALSTQAIFATISQYYSPADLVLFQSILGLPKSVIASSIGNHTSDAKCIADSSSCSEANLDVQYIMGVSPVSPTTYWYTDLSFSAWLITVANAINPPLVLSISYGAEEATIAPSEMTAFSTQAIKLGVMGITVVVASGDDGAVSRKVRVSGVSACSYSPFFPASNPFIVSVGATAGVERGTTEVVCQGDLDQAVTSGGGFSTYYTQPSYQTDAVAGYFFLASNAGTTPVAGFNANGRGYPDVSLAGFNYAVTIGGSLYGVSGTSASCPAIAAFFSSINAARFAAGKGALGFVNQVLYQNATAYINDITSGNNKCAASGVCCTQGFTTTTGWDPATGLGSVDYAKLQSVFLSLGRLANGTLYNPTAKPTPTPTGQSAATLALSLTPIGKTVNIVAAVVVAIVGAIIMVILLFVVYCCCCNTRSKVPTSHPRSRRGTHVQMYQLPVAAASVGPTRPRTLTA